MTESKLQAGVRLAEKIRILTAIARDLEQPENAKLTMAKDTGTVIWSDKCEETNDVEEWNEIKHRIKHLIEDALLRARDAFDNL